MAIETPRLRMNDGRSIPQLGYGLWEIPSERAAELAIEALDRGFRLLDGAAAYRNEAGLGEGLRRSGMPRDEVFVTSKVWNDAQGRDATLRAFDASMERLGLERLDLYLIHWPAPARGLYVETWKALIGLRDEGRVSSIGVSNFSEEHLERIVGETGVTPALNQIELQPRLQQARLRAVHARMGIVTQSWTPLGGGRSFDAPPVIAAAERLSVTPAQVVLRWNLQLGNALLSRTATPERMDENLAILGFTLSEGEMAAIGTLEVGERTGPDPERFS